MNGLRFEVGEMALLVITAGQQRIVQILAKGPFREGDKTRKGFHAGQDGDYVVNCADSPTGGSMVMDWRLRKLDPPAEPHSIVRRQECEA